MVDKHPTNGQPPRELVARGAIRYWHIDRGIPIAFILAIIIQVTTIIWVASKYDSKINDNDKRITTLATVVAARGLPIQKLSERLARMEGKIDVIIKVEEGLTHVGK